MYRSCELLNNPRSVLALADACIFALQASLNESPNVSTWLGLYGFCSEDKGAGVSTGTKPLVEGCEGLTAGTFYLSALSWSVMILTGTGGTDFYPSHHSNSETLIVLVLILYGAILWTRVLAMFCDVATNSSPGLTYFHQQLDGLNECIETNTLPSEMARRLREYCHQMKGVLLHEHAAKSIPNLSPALQIEVVLHCHRRWLDAIWFFRGLEEICLVRFAMGMSSRVLAPNEVAPLRHMYVISRGLVLYGGRVLSQNMACKKEPVSKGGLAPSYIFAPKS